MGPKGSGKSTLAFALQTKYYFHHTAFAEPIKKMLIELVHLQGCSIPTANEMFRLGLKETPTKYLSGQTPRHAMQTLGTEWGRNWIDYNFWVNVWINSIKDHNRVVVDDVRFENEATAIRQEGGVVVFVSRPGVETTDNHSSEKLGFMPDWIITNGDTVEQLVEQLVKGVNK